MKATSALLFVTLAFGQDLFLPPRGNSTSLMTLDDLDAAVGDGYDEEEDDVEYEDEDHVRISPHRRHRRRRSAPRGDTGDCNHFRQHTNYCRTNSGGCGQCVNAGSRPGVMCRGPKTGYYCLADDPPANADMAFACMDWTFGSSAMRAAEAAFRQRTGHNVYLGVGSYGAHGDAMNGLGSCYRVKATGVAKELILQSINSGIDVGSGEFDVQVGNGGVGKFNTCAGGSSPGHNTMFPGRNGSESWGRRYGGASFQSQCRNLPRYPAVDAAMKAAGDDLVSLCEYSFDHNMRHPGGGNPRIRSIGRVRCPSELVNMTWMQRNDEPNGYVAETFLPLALETGANSTKGCRNCLTRMMDCRKPSAAIKDNIRLSMMKPGHKIVQPCTSDGYTRIDVQCGCRDCYC